MFMTFYAPTNRDKLSGSTVTLERAASPLGGRRISASYLIGLPDVPKKDRT